MSQSQLNKLLKSRAKTIVAKNTIKNTVWICNDIVENANKFIFRANGELIVSDEGDAIIGSWSYLADANSFLLTILDNAFLLNAFYVDSNLMILVKDGSSEQFFQFTNDQTFSFESIAEYFASKHGKSVGLKVIPLLNNEYLNISGGKEIIVNRIGQDAFVTDANYSWMLAEGVYITASKSHAYWIRSGSIIRVSKVAKVDIKGLGQVEIERTGLEENSSFSENLTQNGKIVSDGIYYDNWNRRYTVNNGKIQKLEYQVVHLLSNGMELKVLQKNDRELSTGDKIEYPNVPDGKYRLKNKLKTIRIKDSFVI
jgi:hypothetical protein